MKKVKKISNKNNTQYLHMVLYDFLKLINKRSKLYETSFLKEDLFRV